MHRLIVLLLMALAVSAAEPASSSFRAHLVAGVIVSAPAAWMVQTPTPGSLLLLRSAADPTIADSAARERARASVTVINERLITGTDLNGFVQTARSDLARFGTNLVIDEAGSMLMSDHEWRRIRYRFDIGPYTFVQVAHLTVIDGMGVIVTCSSGAETSDRWRVAFAGIGAGLRRAVP